MVYGRDFFELQLDFARTVAALFEMPVDRALLDYTNFYIRFGLGRDFDPCHPIWRWYVDGLTRTSEFATGPIASISRKVQIHGRLRRSRKLAVFPMRCRTRNVCEFISGMRNPPRHLL